MFSSSSSSMMMMRDIVNGKDLLEMVGGSVDNIVFED